MNKNIQTIGGLEISKFIVGIKISDALTWTWLWNSEL